MEQLDLTARELLAPTDKLEGDVVGVIWRGRLFDLHTPLVGASGDELTVVRAGEPKGLEIVRHSASHVMADAVQRLFPGTKITIGPAIEGGFYYDFDKPGAGFSESDLTRIEEVMRAIIALNTPFRREVILREQALELFRSAGEQYKVEIIEDRSKDETLTLYRHGRPGEEWFDFCAGPHVPSTGFIKAVKLTSAAGAYWRGDERNQMLQRIYGTAFTSEEALQQHLKELEEARARDHRKLGKELDLFIFDAVSPAAPFFTPKGTFVYNALFEVCRRLYKKYGYEEVVTPQVFSPAFFSTSGHLQTYHDNMFRLWTDDELDELLAPPKPDSPPPTMQELRALLHERSYGLKPMNCPGHCIMFRSKVRSYRELPWRVADFGRLHRYERGGVTLGLARVRSFCQDDGHVLCAVDQVPSEIELCLRMLTDVYGLFGFTDTAVKLALRPTPRIGNDNDWDIAEAALAAGLDRAGLPYERLEGEGAFYGPKIEFHVKDALGRTWQLGTIQYDPAMPERFGLRYTGEDGMLHRPVMLHRAILGSVERFFGVYLEHCGGNFPTWLAPSQAIILTVSEKSYEFAHSAQDRLIQRGIRVDLDNSSEKLGAKIRTARLARYPYICVAGPKEAANDALGVRSRDRGELGAISINACADLILNDRPEQGDWLAG